MTGTKDKKNPNPTLFQAIIPIAGLFVCLTGGYGILKMPTSVCLIGASIIAGLVGLWIGISWNDMIEGITEKVKASFGSLLVIICVGALISSWIFSGTIPMLIYYGIKMINPHFLFVTGFLICAILSSFTGTSFGSAGTAGVAIMGVGIAIGAPLPITAGCIISGAVFGDKLSPLSDTTMLAPVAAGCNLYDHIKHMISTTGLASIIAIIVYLIAGFNLSEENMTSPELIEQMLGTLEALFEFNFLLFLPPIIVLLGGILRKPTVPVMLISSFLAIILGVVFQNFTFETGITAFYSGFHLNMTDYSGAILPQIEILLNRGGLLSIMETVLLLFCAFSFGGIYSKSGCIKVIFEKLMEKIKSVASLISSTLIAGCFITVVTGSCYLSILIPGEMFAPAYDKFNLHRKNLSRSLEDAGTCIEPLIPWAVSGTYMYTTLGVPTLEYLPWAVLCYSSFLFALFFAITGITIKKSDDTPYRTKPKKNHATTP